MKVSDLVEKTKWTLLTKNTQNPDISGVYVCDLLSWVMGKGNPGEAWVTVQVHLNVIAVAVLREFSCVIISDDASVPDEVIQKAEEENLALIHTTDSSYVCAKTLSSLGL